jgi:predicted ATPase
MQDRESARSGMHTLIVEIDADDLAFQYMYRESESAPPLASFRVRFREESIRAIDRELNELLLSAAVSPGPGIEEQLQNLGGQLCDNIVPSEIVQRLSRSSSECPLILYLSPRLAWIPWELIWDGSDFLCQKFLVSRRITGTAAELGAAEGRLRERRSGRGALIVFGNTTNLQADAEKRSVEKALGEMYGPNIWFYADVSKTSILEELKKDYEICHFVGHGACEEMRKPGWNLANGAVLTSDDIESVSSKSTFPLLVFANSCNSAKPSTIRAQQDICSLYQAFLKQGVPHYVGSIAPLSDDHSCEFATVFYRSLAVGMSIGRALWRARHHSRERSKVPVWAFYVHYGDPTYSFTLGVRKNKSAFFPEIVTTRMLEAEDLSIVRPLCVGRDKELDKTRRQLAQLEQRQSGILLISGELGTGKTTLLQHILFEARQRLRGLVLATSNCNKRIGDSEPYSAMKQLFHSLLRCSARVEIEGNVYATGDWLLAEVLKSFPQLAALFKPEVALGKARFDRFCDDLGVALPTMPGATDQFSQTDIFDQFVRLIKRLASANPVIVAVDSAQWIDDSSAAFLPYLADALSGSQTLMIFCYRTEHQYLGAGAVLNYVTSELRRHGARSVSLDVGSSKDIEQPRAEEFVKEFVDEVYAPNKFPLWFLKRLARHTAGNALFLSEILKYTSEKGQISKEADGWQIKIATEDFELPDSVSGIIQERIGQLSEELREILTCASVEGEQFTAQVLATLRGLQEDELLATLLENLQKQHQIIEEHGEHEITPDKILSLFNFRNTLFQQHLYRDLSSIHKRKLHKRIGECLEELYGPTRFTIASQLSTHFRLAREWGKAFEYGVAAARAFVDVRANQDAIRAYQVALEIWELLTAKNTELRFQLCLELAETLKRVGRYDEALDSYRRIAESTNCPTSIRARALNGIGDVRGARGEYEIALREYRACESLALEFGDAELLEEVSTDLAELFYSKSQNERDRGPADEMVMSQTQAGEYAQKAVQDGEKQQAWENVRRALVVQGNLFLSTRDFESAEKFFVKATELAEKYDLDRLSLNNSGEILRLTNRYDDALIPYEAYLKWALRTGATRQEIIARTNLGLTALGKHDWEIARDHFNQALELNRPRRHVYASMIALAGMGISFGQQGAESAATDYYRRALEAGGITCEGLNEAGLRERLGRMLYAHEEFQLSDALLK